MACITWMPDHPRIEISQSARESKVKSTKGLVSELDYAYAKLEIKIRKL